MDLKNWYDRVWEQLDRLDFPALWAGFAPCPFALYTHDTAVLNGEAMPRPAEFYGNTSVCRQGEYLAIWNMEADPPADVAGLAASLVHEMFHSFQFRCGEQGWPDDLVLAATEPQPAFLALRAQEHRALTGGAPLSEVLALRQSRAALQPELLLEEARMETIEGTAEYVGRLALAHLSSAACKGACARSAQRLLQWPDLRRGAYDSGPWLLRRARRSGGSNGSGQCGVRRCGPCSKRRSGRRGTLLSAAMTPCSFGRRTACSGAGAFSLCGRRMARCAVCSVRALCSLRTIPTGRRRCLCRECDKIVTCESLARHRGMVK